jgi:hypothetical protein
MPLIICEGTLAPMALYISTLVSHNDRAGFIDEPKSSSSTRKTGFHFHLSLLSHLCLFNTLFHVYPTTARMKNVAGLVKRHLAGFFLTVVAP